MSPLSSGALTRRTRASDNAIQRVRARRRKQTALRQGCVSGDLKLPSDRTHGGSQRRSVKHHTHGRCPLNSRSLAALGRENPAFPTLPRSGRMNATSRHPRQEFRQFRQTLTLRQLLPAAARVSASLQVLAESAKCSFMQAAIWPPPRFTPAQLCLTSAAQALARAALSSRAWQGSERSAKCSCTQAFIRPSPGCDRALRLNISSAGLHGGPLLGHRARGGEK